MIKKGVLLSIFLLKISALNAWNYHLFFQKTGYCWFDARTAQSDLFQSDVLFENANQLVLSQAKPSFKAALPKIIILKNNLRKKFVFTISAAAQEKIKIALHYGNFQTEGLLENGVCTLEMPAEKYQKTVLFYLTFSRVDESKNTNYIVENISLTFSHQN